MADDSAIHVSVILPTYNGMPIIHECLRSVLSQVAPWPFEVMIIDSGSTDGTWEFVQSQPVSCLQIDAKDFNHGATRNLGAEKSKGQYVVFLVQDAVPADNLWLTTLVEACESTGAAGSYSRQLVRSEGGLLSRYQAFGKASEPSRRCLKRLPASKRFHDLMREEQFRLSQFENVSSCIRKSSWEKYPFRRMPFGEDMEWGKRVIEQGGTIVYEPSSAVYHSHDRSPRYLLKRAYADHFLVTELFNLVLVPNLARAVRTALAETRAIWRFALGQQEPTRIKLSSMVIAPWYVGSLVLGEYLGSHIYFWLPRHAWLRSWDRLLRTGV